jgi:hypothetical protein
MKKSNVVKLKQTSPVFNEKLVLLQNLNQVLTQVVKQCGAKTTLMAVQSMIQDAQKSLRQDIQTKKVANG